MATKKTDYLTIALSILFIAIGIFSVRYSIGLINLENSNTESNMKNLTIDKQTFNKAVMPAETNSNVTTQNGYGKSNPFSPIQ